MVLQRKKFVAVLPLYFLILSGQVSREAGAKTEVGVSDVDHHNLETKVEDAMLSSESLEDATNGLTAVKEVSFCLLMLWKLSI